MSKTWKSKSWQDHPKGGLYALNNGSKCAASIRAASCLQSGFFRQNHRFTSAELAPFNTCNCPADLVEYCAFGWLQGADEQ